MKPIFAKYDWRDSQAEESYLVERDCRICRGASQITMSERQLQERIDKGLVQAIFPNVSREEREVLTTGTHPECWNALFLPNQYDQDSEDPDEAF